MLADLAQIWPGDEKAAWNETLCALLAELRPDVYSGWEAAQLTTALKPHPLVKVADIGRRIDGKAVTRRGIRHADLLAAITERNRRSGLADLAPRVLALAAGPASASTPASTQSPP